MKKIDALPIASLKEQLTAEIAPIDSALKKKEAAEKAAKEKAAQEAAQAQAEKAAAAQETTTANNSQSSEADYVLSPNTPTNTNNQPIIPARESDLADSSNPAGIGRLVSKKRSLQPQLLAAMSLKGVIPLSAYES